MAHPLFIIDQAMYQFSSQWYTGLKPSLEIRTEYDGSVVVNSKMLSSNRSPINWWWEKGTSQFPFSSTSRSKRAKKNARYRRNKARKMEASKSRITTTDVETVRKCETIKKSSKLEDAVFIAACHLKENVENMTSSFLMNHPCNEQNDVL